MADNSNTIAGWVLAAGIVALGTSIVFGKMFHSEVRIAAPKQPAWCEIERKTRAAHEVRVRH